jgi:hypothetical protein
VLDPDQPPGWIECHCDRIQTNDVRIRPVRSLDQPTARHLSHPRALAAPDRLERTYPGVSEVACLHFAERQSAPVECDEIELAPSGAVVALDDLKAAPCEMVGGEAFAELTEPVTGVVAHEMDATPRAVTRGTRRVPIQRRPAGAPCAELEHGVTHVSQMFA